MAATSKSATQIYFNKDHDMVRKAVREFVDKEINPFMDEWEEKGAAPLHDLFKKMGDLGFLGIRYDTEYGGQGMDYWYDTVCLEELGRIHGSGIPVAIAVQTHMATPAIDEYGSEYLKETYLKPAIAGDMVAAIAVTEPGAGSDVSAIQTTAKKEGDFYVINGCKTYITNGTQADYLTLLARTSDDPGYNSFSLLIGNEGEGFVYQMRQFQHERFSAIPMSYISAEEIMAMTVEHLRQRIVFGKPLITKQVLRHRLADWQTETECLRQLTYHIVRMKEAGLDVTREVSMAKLYAAQLLMKVADGCLQMYGGLGFMNEMLISRCYRDARLIAIGGGADEIMREIIAKMELG